MSQAWLLNLGAGCRVAVGIGELVHLLYSPPTFDVPQTPSHVHEVLAWNDRLVPLVDLVHLVHGDTDQESHVVVGIVACQSPHEAAVLYAALSLATPPVRVAVDDNQACGLPAPEKAWDAIVLSCFEHQGARVPVLDIRQLIYPEA